MREERGSTFGVVGFVEYIVVELTVELLVGVDLVAMLIVFI
mgnify:CR=1 FL=1